LNIDVSMLPGERYRNSQLKTPLLIFIFLDFLRYSFAEQESFPNNRNHVSSLILSKMKSIMGFGLCDSIKATALVGLDWNKSLKSTSTSQGCLVF
jgi:hypothetical protein